MTTGGGSWLFSFHPHTRRREKERERRETDRDTQTDRHIYTEREKTVEQGYKPSKSVPPASL